MNKIENTQKKRNQKLLVAGAAIAGTTLVRTQPASAQATDPVEQVNSMVTNLGTITGGVVTVIIASLTVRLAVKQVNRLMTKA